jgi:capsular exopolysaccharide synthesis family protein
MYLTPTPERPATEAEPRFNLPHLVRIGRRHFRLMAIIFLLILGASAAITMRMTPVYTADAHLMIDKPGEQLLRKDDDSPQTMVALDTGTVESEVQVLRSPALAEAVVRDLRLDKDPEFNGALTKPSLLTRAKAWLSQFGSKPTKASGPSYGPVVDATLGALKVTRVGSSYIIDLAFTSRDPDKAALIANTFARDYLKMQLEAKFDVSREANAWLYGHIGELRQRVLDADAALQTYKIQNNLMSAQGATLTEQEISSLDQQAATAHAGQAEAQARLNTARQQLASGSAGDDVGEALTSPVVQGLRAQQASLSAKVANLESHYGPRFPDLIKAKDELATVDAQIQTEIKRIISNLQAQANVASERAASIDRSVAQARGGLADTNRSMVKLNELQRNADAERTLYETFLNKFKEIGAEAGLAKTDAHVVSPAQPPTGPSAPRKTLNLAFGLVLGLAAAVTAALIAEMFETGLIEAEIVERDLSAPYLGSIPSLASIAPPDDPLRGRPIDHLIAKPMSSFAESFRSLRAAIDFSRLGSRVKVLAVTSSLSGEGKTTTSIGIARSAATAGMRAVVVDCDLRQRAVNAQLGVSPTVGLLEVLEGSASLEQALVLDAVSGAMVLPLVQYHHTPKDVFSSEAMARLLDELRRRFDLVVLDTAPVVLVTDARSVARQADAVLLLVHWRKTSRALVQTAIRLLTSAGATIAGVALTRVDLRRPASIDPGDPTAYYLTHKNYYAA